jgi:hypothetical protein
MKKKITNQLQLLKTTVNNLSKAAQQQILGGNNTTTATGYGMCINNPTQKCTPASGGGCVVIENPFHF